MSIGNTTCFRQTSFGITFRAPFWNGLDLLALALDNCPYIIGTVPVQNINACFL